MTFDQALEGQHAASFSGNPALTAVDHLNQVCFANSEQQ